MSLAINVNTIRAVLLIDGWHDVKDQSFAIDAYEFEDRTERQVRIVASGSSGATWTGTDGLQIACPMESILAVRY